MLDRRVDPQEDSGLLEPRFHPPGDLHIGHVPAVSTVATATQAARADGGKWVVTGFEFRVGSVSAITATSVGCAVIDGASGGGTYLYRGILSVTAVAGAMFAIERNSLNLVGTANTALTIEFTGPLTNGYESVNLELHVLGGNGV